MPLLMALCTVVGILIGTFYTNHFAGNRLNIINTESNRLNNLLHIIDDQYVDSVDANEIVEKAIPQILSELDPHSIYVSAKEVEYMNDDLKGSFCGIGIEFTIREDTIHVQNVVSDGPAERAGLVAGDKIVAIDGKPFVGKEVTNTEAMRRLKGEKNTKVNIGVLSFGSKKVKTYTLTRDEIRTKSIETAYMLNDTTGYIRVKKFAENTYPELLIALATLSQENFRNLVIDLRDNTGGYMQTAVQMANEFLPANRLITYMEGRRSPRKDFKSDGRGAYQNMPLVVLIDEGSASSSEIFAGAIQDNDRGTIIGRRSFGKGLVQSQIPFEDGSALRLTVARYYTPTGRSIQKPYTAGSTDYELDLANRFIHNEYFSADSIHFADSLRFTTPKGKVVYGGGGIMPDKFVPLDTTRLTKYYLEVSGRNILYRYTIEYADEHRRELDAARSIKELEAMFAADAGMFDRFVTYAARSGVRPVWRDIARSRPIMEAQLKAYISRNSELESNAFYYFIRPIDETVLCAIETLRNEPLPEPVAEPKKREKRVKISELQTKKQ